MNESVERKDPIRIRLYFEVLFRFVLFSVLRLKFFLIKL